MIKMTLTHYTDMIGSPETGYLVNLNEEFMHKSTVFLPEDTDDALLDAMIAKGLVPANTTLTDLSIIHWDDITFIDTLDGKPICQFDYC